MNVFWNALAAIHANRVLSDSSAFCSQRLNQISNLRCSEADPVSASLFYAPGIARSALGNPQLQVVQGVGGRLKACLGVISI
ncbi:MAG: hypothetical protein OXQ86_08865 [Gammaproteobacteria bacterium]|nr:hypothetical protein [Gammaproteobacteria bacterium]MDE0414030.1 hypothetical protein [Gammaproteobacteria bacterium]